MKNIFNITFCLISLQLFSQITIGNINNSNANKTSILLDFENTNDRGILLPTVSSISSINTEGTIVLDATNNNAALIKLKKDANNWHNYGLANGNASSITNNRPSTTDLPNSKVIIGHNISTVDGALVLESTNKSIVLPIVSSVDNIINPSPGMMVYLNRNICQPYYNENLTCTDQFLAFYNGTEWSFWGFNKPGITIDPPIQGQ